MQEKQNCNILNVDDDSSTNFTGALIENSSTNFIKENNMLPEREKCAEGEEVVEEELEEADDEEYNDEEEEMDEAAGAEKSEPKPNSAQPNDDELLQNGVNSLHTTSTTNGLSTAAVDEIHFMKKNILFLNHQMMKLMNAMSVRVCDCSQCKTVQFPKHNDVNSRKRSHIEKVGNCVENVKQRKLDAENELENEIHSSPSSPTTSYNNDSDDSSYRDESKVGAKAGAEKSTVDTLAAVQPTINTATNFASKSADSSHCLVAKRGRKSKYCSPTQKKAVAGYAQTHGASAAARKFNIPPAVAAYYHRKEFKSPKTFESAEDAAFFPANFNPQAENAERKSKSHPDQFITHKAIIPSAQSITTSASSTKSTENNVQSHFAINSTTCNSSSAMMRRDEGAANNASSANSSPSHLNEAGGNASVLPQCEANNNELHPGDGIWDSLEKNATHSGSPGFLRGRGRGRPKLIGDELDAELVEYMVQLKCANRQHLTASQALQIARSYISEKSPGLLEEHGGQIKLKITWAMKLVSRIAEREREIQLGLPAGSLQNVGRTMPSNLSNGLMNELMAQNLFGQQNVNAKNGLVGNSSDSQLQENTRSISGTTSSSLNSNWQQSVPMTAPSSNALVTSTLSSGANGCMDSIYNTASNAQSAASMAATMMSLLNKFPEPMNNAASAMAAAELFDPSFLLAELGIGSLEELSQNEPFKSLLQNIRREEEHAVNGANNASDQSGVRVPKSEILATSSF